MAQKKSKHIALPADKQIRSKKIPPGQPSETQQLIHEQRVHQIQLEKTVSLLRGTLDSTADGILVVNNEGKIESFNQRFIELWGIPESIIASKDDDQALAFVLDQLKNPEQAQCSSLRSPVKRIILKIFKISLILKFLF